MAKISQPELWQQCCMLASLVGGIDVLYEAAQGPDGCETTERARNAIQPTIDVITDKAWALCSAIEYAELSNSSRDDAFLKANSESRSISGILPD